jgi:hypothetical protein
MLLLIFWQILAVNFRSNYHNNYDDVDQRGVPILDPPYCAFSI